MFIVLQITLGLYLFGYFSVQASRMRVPDFVSQWYYIESVDGKDLIDIYHNLREVPALVSVQSRSRTGINNGYIFPGIGIVPRDDDHNDPYAGIVYIYNERKVTVSALSMSNHFQGRTIYTENSNHWEGPNSDSSYSAYVRVKAWKTSSLPRPDFHIEDIEIKAGCGSDPGCYFEKRHGFGEYPSMVVVRTKLLNPSSEYNGFWSDAVGSALMVYENMEWNFNGYVIYGFNSEEFRIWTDSSEKGYIFNGEDGGAFNGNPVFKQGALEIIAWLSSTLTPMLEENIQLGVIPGGEFDKDKAIAMRCSTEDLIVNLWAEAGDGINVGYRFPGSGSLSYTQVQTASPCSYGGLTFAYTNTSVRLWKPGTSNLGKTICIPSIFGGGRNMQGSNIAEAKLHIWIPQISVLNLNCSSDVDCFDSHSACINNTCLCKTGYYEYDNECLKVQTCQDRVPRLPELEKRARNYVVDTSSISDQIIDDNNLKLSWYNVTTTKQFMMADSLTRPNKDACGSKHQFVINGSHPSFESLTEMPKELLVCYNECKETAPVMVRKCRDGSVHYLIGSLPIKQSAYCVDPEEISGIKVFDPAPEIGELKLQLNVELNFDIGPSPGNPDVTNYLPYLTFSCVPDNPMTSDALFYTTYWYIDRKLFIAIGPSPKIEQLTEQMLLDRSQQLDIYMSCAVRASVSKNGLLSSLQISPEKFYGIKAINPIVIIEKGKNAFITLEPTAPIGCLYSSNYNAPLCDHTFYMVHPDTETCDLGGLINVQQTPRCGGAFNSTKVNQTWKAGEKFQFELTTEDKNFADGHQFTLTLEMADHWHKIWNLHRIKNIRVYVTHSDSYKFKQCYSHVDPHMQTADMYHYENQYSGEFILYRNTKYGIEVQEKTTSCNNGWAFCACAVAVRAGGDVFLINLCGGLTFIGFTSCTDGGILDVRKRTALRYQVVTPIGTYINIQMNPHPNYDGLLNIDVFMAAKDIGQTEGLCGYFDDNYTNDLKTRSGKVIPTKNDKVKKHPDFSQEWRIAKFEQNYLLLDPGKVPKWKSDMFCYCNKSLLENEYDTSFEATGVCSASLFLNCSEHKSSVTKELWDLCSIRHDRKRRSIPDNVSRMELNRRQNLVNKEPTHRVKKQNQNGNMKLTVDLAADICSQFIKSQAAVKEFSHRLKGIDTAQVIEECTYDVYEGNDPSWATVYPSVLNQVIEANNERDPNYVKAHEEEVKRFNVLSCPFNCSENGNCTVEGDCECFGQFHGPDCSIDENQKLVINDIEGDGHCDLKYGQNCQCFHIQTKNLLEQFHCKVKERLIMMNGTEVTIGRYVNKGSYNDIFNGECCRLASRTEMPEYEDGVFTKQLIVSISNNGLNYSNDVKLLVYDSRCQEARGKTDVVLKDHSCFISGKCSFENETSSSDKCFVCLPEMNKYKWTNNCTVFVSVNQELANSLSLIIGVCVGLLLALIIICITLLLLKRQSKRSISDSNVFEMITHKEMQHKYRRPNLEIFYAEKR